MCLLSTVQFSKIGALPSERLPYITKHLSPCQALSIFIFFHTICYILPIFLRPCNLLHSLTNRVSHSIINEATSNRTRRGGQRLPIGCGIPAVVAFSLVAQWIEHSPPKRGVPRSNRGKGAILNYLVFSSGVAVYSGFMQTAA